jgi:ferritin-like metal-binding protein YciE
MAEMGTLHDAFVDELRDSYDAEKAVDQALPKMAKAANSPELREAIESHLEETRQQVERLEQVFESLDEKASGKHCDGIAGIIQEAQALCRKTSMSRRPMLSDRGSAARRALRNGGLRHARRVGARDGSR